MRFSRRAIVFDAADLPAESAFWAGLLGGIVSEGERWHNVWVDGEWQLGVQLVPDHVAPDWPDGTPQQIHFDLYLDDGRDLQAAHEQVLKLGGRLLKKTSAAPGALSGAQVYADPAGHPFCLCWLPPQVGDRVKLTYPDGAEIEGIWAEETSEHNRVPVLRLDDGTIHRDVTGEGRRSIVRKAWDDD